MGDVISIPAMLFILFIVGALVGLIINTARKKQKVAKLIEANIACLPIEVKQFYDSCRSRDQFWIQEYGTTLDAIELTDPLEVAVDAGWRAMDRAAEFLTLPDFSSKFETQLQFADALREAEKQFDIADVLAEQSSTESEE
ncbi:MAG TPA: hypothetical protein VJ579_03020 [Candidatus Paceibacterota bacterium]|nr:hypothetical protein [Candidatus Paceibacterota bacterium]